ncbi:MAG: hypothetical protein C0608_02855 [Deltaproteobacteria bacterium]|nr:MAG: hypothetical protein C0608_02855 [Deltaproteobacteria bacterium]
MKPAKAFTKKALISLLSIAAILTASYTFAATAEEIEARSDAAMEQFTKTVSAGKALLEKADGYLIFPSVIKAGLGIGGEYGEGALRVGGKTVQYYSTAAGSIGFQFGAQSKSVLMLFMTKDSLEQFRNSDGWEVGVDGSVALIELGAGGSIDTTNFTDPVIAFIFGQKGLMYNLTLEGTKMTKIVR